MPQNEMCIDAIFESYGELIMNDLEEFIKRNYPSEQFFFVDLPKEERINGFKLFFAELVGKL